MYLSRVEVNPRRRDTMKALKSPEIIHAAVMASFPTLGREGNDRVLWRIDRLGPSEYILVQSQIKPDFTHIVEQFGWPESDQQWDTLNYDDFLNNIRKGDVRRFCIRANPTRSVMQNDSKSKRGKVCQHITVEQQLGWLVERSEKCGFTVNDSNLSLKITERENLRFKNKNNNISLTVVVYEGILRVEDPKLFLDAIGGGIGRAKAYGCGLMTVSRAVE